MEHHNECPLCLSENIHLRFSCIDHFISGESFPVFVCAECGFNFTQDHPGEEVIGKYYESENYISHSDSSKGLTNKLYLIARRFMLLKKARSVFRATGHNKGSLLDIGSGTGYFGATMKRYGWDVTGIEINEKAREFSASQFDLDVIAPEDMSLLKSESFDCITLWHVLEHFQYPYRYMIEILRLLKPGGSCIIALPNCSSYDAYYYGRYWAAWDVPRHLLHFNPSTFGLFANKTGFRLQKIKKLPLDVFYISLLSERYKGSKLNFLAGLIKGAWFWLLSLVNKERSSSLMYIIKKSELIKKSVG